MQGLWIPGPLPGLNEVIDAKSRVYGRKGAARSDGYAKLKARWTADIKVHILRQAFRPVDAPAYFTYLHVEHARRRDPSNFVAGARKIVEDALKTSGMIPNDGWEHVKGFRDFWTLNALRPGCLVVVGAELEPEEQMLARYERVLRVYP